MYNDKTGGAAFPHESTHMDRTGMTLRDYFAGQAIGHIVGGLLTNPDHMTYAAGLAYEVADWMIAEREKVGE